jgi:GTPase
MYLNQHQRESLASYCILLLIDMSENIEDIRIKYESCWDVLDELKVDKPKVFVVFSKFDSVTDSGQTMKDIANNLQISNPIAISSKTGYGIHKLKSIIGSHKDVVELLTS